jgi:O-antigen/teichoic acid export membrane protein
MSSPELTLLGKAARRHIMGGSLRILLAEGLILPTGLITASVLTRYLGPSKYGLFTLSSMVVFWIEFCVTSFFARSTIKLIGDTAEDWRPWSGSVVRIHLLIGSAAALLLWLLSPRLALLMNEPALAGYFRLFSLDIPLSSLATAHRNILIGRRRYRERALASASRLTARLVLMVALVVLGFSVEGAIWATIGASLLDLAVGRYYARAPLWGSFPVPTRKIWHYALPLFLSGVGLTLFEKLDLFVLKILGTTAAVAGMYGAAQNLTIMPSLLGGALAPVLLAALTHAVRGGELPLARELSRDSIRFIVCLLPFAAMAAGAAPAIVVLVVGRAFASTATFLAFLIFAGFARLLIAVTTATLIAADRPGWVLALTGSLAPIALVAHFLVIPRWGALGASAVTTVLSLLSAGACVAAAYASWNVAPSGLTLIRSVMISFLAYWLAMAWPATGPLLLVKLATISALILVAYLGAGEFGTNRVELICTLARSKWPSEGRTT